MSYEPTNWKAGDVVTSAKLNKMEQGIAASGGIRVVHVTGNEGDPSLQLDITPNELMNAFENEEIVVVIGYDKFDRSQSLISDFYNDGETFAVTINEDYPEFTSSDPDEYFIYNPNSESSDDSGDSGTGR